MNTWVCCRARKTPALRFVVEAWLPLLTATWVLTYSFVVVPPAEAATITAMEYYLDADPGVGKGTPIPSIDGAYNSSTETGQMSLDTTGLKPGPHLLHLRARSSSGVWGTYPPQLIYVYQRTAVVAAEYFIDTDPGVGKGTSLEAVDGHLGFVQEAIIASVPIGNLARGSHNLYVRACSSAGVWGAVRTVPFEVLNRITVTDAQFGFGRGADTQPSTITTPMEPADFAFDSPVEELAKYAVTAPTSEGVHRLFVRAKDSQGLWGNWVYADFRVATTQGFQAWLDGSGLTGEQRAPSADPDRDGVANIVEFACNLSPVLSDAQVLATGTGTKGLPAASLSRIGVGTRLRLEYLRRKNMPEISYFVQFSSRLAAQGDPVWTPATGTEAVTPINSEWERIVVEDTEVMPNQPSRFGGLWIRFIP